jgi:hypothetical protein
MQREVHNKLVETTPQFIHADNYHEATAEALLSMYHHCTIFSRGTIEIA